MGEGASGGDGSGTLLFKGRKMQRSKAFFSICSLAIPLENSRRHADDIMSYNWEISVILWDGTPAYTRFLMEAALYLCV